MRPTLLLGTVAAVAGTPSICLLALLLTGAAEAGPTLLAIAVVLLAFDFLAYWAHRLQHAVPAFWAVHRMHHDESHLHGATGVRQQWLQLPFVQIATLLPLAWLFGPVVLHPAVFWIPVMFW